MCTLSSLISRKMAMFDKTESLLGDRWNESSITESWLIPSISELWRIQSISESWLIWIRIFCVWDMIASFFQVSAPRHPSQHTAAHCYTLQHTKHTAAHLISYVKWFSRTLQHQIECFCSLAGSEVSQNLFSHCLAHLQICIIPALHQSTVLIVLVDFFISTRP